MKLYYYLKLAFMGTLFFDRTTAETCLRADDFNYGCNKDGCYFFEGDAMATSGVAIASRPVNFTGAEFREENQAKLREKNQKVGEIACQYQAESGAKFSSFYKGDATISSSSNWQRNKKNSDLFDCKSKSNEVNDCPFAVIKNS
ncbi:MAG: hypothetical protein WAL30_02545 [Candidatus Aquirickettsiella sp.]